MFCERMIILMEGKVSDICFEINEHFMKIAVRQIVQDWL